MRILGIDPGYGRMGWGVIEGDGRDWKYVAHGCVDTDPKKDFLDRLVDIASTLREVIVKHEPIHAAVEDLFFAKNVKTAMKVGQARGVILLTLVEAGLSVSEYTPTQIKSAVTGIGSAPKTQVQRLVQMSLQMKEVPTQDDAADALATALTAGLLGASYK